MDQKEESGYPHLMRAFADQEEEIKRLKAELAEAVRLGDERLVTLWDEKKAELKAANETIDMLYERSGRFAAQADKYEQELKEAKAEIIRLRRHLGEIP